MTLFDEPAESSKPQDPPCAVCAKPAPWVVWTYRVCIPCFQALADVEPFTFISIGHEDDHEAFCAEATKRTAAWVAQQTNTNREKTP